MPRLKPFRARRSGNRGFVAEDVGKYVSLPVSQSLRSIFNQKISSAHEAAIPNLYSCASDEREAKQRRRLKTMRA